MNTSNIVNKALETAQVRALFGAENACLLMVSGGSDSTALTYVMAKLRAQGDVGALAMLHINHQLRGKAANEDAAFCAQLADALDIPFFCCEVDVAGEAKRAGRNLEAQGRFERYAAAADALASLCEHEGYALSAGRIVVAHTADDRAENFYMRSILGAGPGAFRGMNYQRDNIVRPLLDCTRQELRDFISAQDNPIQDMQGALWREDATNEHTDHFRAFVRANIIPPTREWNARATENLVRSMNLIADEDNYLETLAFYAIAHHDDYTDNSVLLLPSFATVELPLQRRAVRKLLQDMLPVEDRVEAQSIERVLAAFEDGAPKSGYVDNVQGNLAISANKQGVRIEPMSAFRQRRKKG